MSLKQIAKMTGVSVSTVGRILSDPNHKCANEETRQRVFSAAREINYIPNDAARRLKTGSAAKRDIYYVNVLLTRTGSETADPFYDELLILIEKEIRNRGCIVSGVWHQGLFSDDKYCRSADVDAMVSELYSGSTQKADGFIVIGRCSPKVMKALKKKEKNIVSINRNSNNYEADEVLCDGRKIAAEAVGYLIKLGHTKIGYVGDCHNESRFTGYQSTLMHYHLSSDIDHIFDTTPNEKNGFEAMEYFLKLSDPPTAVYCANDILAIGMLKCLARRRSRFYSPSIISSDDIEQAQYTTPMLTTVSLPKSEMARFALILLLDRIKGGHRTVSRLEMEGTLIIRESCRPPRDMSEPEYYI